MELTEVLAKVMAKAGITEEDLAKMADMPAEPAPLADWRQGFDERFDSAHPAMWDFRKLSASGAEKEFESAREWLREFTSDFQAASACRTRSSPATSARARPASPERL